MDSVSTKTYEVEELGDEPLPVLVHNFENQFDVLDQADWPYLKDSAIYAYQTIVQEDYENPLNIYIHNCSLEQATVLAETGYQMPLVIYLHGGSIRRAAGIAEYPRALNAAFSHNPHLFLSLDHRDSQSHELNIKYSLQSRQDDITAALSWLESSNYRHIWNGNTMLIGVSMGGHVASRHAYFNNVNALALIVPAIYAENALNVNFGRNFTEAIKDKYLDSITPFLLARLMSMNPKMLLSIITKKEDRIVTAEMADFLDSYTESMHRNLVGKGIPTAYVRFIDEGGHSSTSWKEIEILIKMFNRLF